ncbi:Os02g0751100, partial [Oryza sativa Japonica Group]
SSVHPSVRLVVYLLALRILCPPLFSLLASIVPRALLFHVPRLLLRNDHRCHVCLSFSQHTFCEQMHHQYCQTSRLRCTFLFSNSWPPNTNPLQMHNNTTILVLDYGEGIAFTRSFVKLQGCSMWR